MRILAIDPGPTQSAFVELNEDGSLGPSGKCSNQDLLDRVNQIATSSADVVVVIEMIASYGMAVGAEVFETCVWIGRYVQAWDQHRVTPAQRMFRMKVKSHLCHSAKANDSNIRQALIDRYGPGKDTAIGSKKAPGPLYGVAGDVWAALAVACTFADQQATRLSA